MIRAVRTSDAARIAGIYNHYVKNTIVTFELDELDEKEMANRIETVTSQHPWIVWEENAKLCGYAYASAWKARSAYRNSVETTIYLDAAFTGRGMGKVLYSELLKLLRQTGFHTAIGGIALPNESSVALHEKMGFIKTAHFKEVGYKFDHWIDVAYWQIILNKSDGKDV